MDCNKETCPVKMEDGPIKMEDGYISFYLLDIYENNYSSPGTVYLIGKKVIDGTRETESCCIIVQNIKRNLYVLPKSKIDGSGLYECDRVLEELLESLPSKKIYDVETNIVNKKYCFYGQNVVPNETDYVNLRYSFKQPALKRMNDEFVTFERIFGLKSTGKEVLILESKIQGPCWLKIKAEPCSGSKKAKSWCKSEYKVSNYHSDFIKPMINNNNTYFDKAPVFKILSLGVQTVQNKETESDQIVALSLLYHDNVDLNKTESKLNHRHVNYICRPEGQEWPDDFIVNIKGDKTIISCSNETVLLILFTNQLYEEDPDIMISHNFFNSDMALLLERMSANKVFQWDKLGRIKKYKSPPKKNTIST